MTKAVTKITSEKCSKVSTDCSLCYTDFKVNEEILCLYISHNETGEVHICESCVTKFLSSLYTPSKKSNTVYSSRNKKILDNSDYTVLKKEDVL